MAERKNRALSRKEILMKQTTGAKIGIVLGATLLSTLTGCVGPGTSSRTGPLPPDYVDVGMMAPDEFIYYPAYQIYYISNRDQYLYRVGRAWVVRPTPPGVAVEVLFASPAVRLDFHDAPEMHHASVLRQYPQHWQPPGNPDHGSENRTDGKAHARDARKW